MRLKRQKNYGRLLHNIWEQKKTYGAIQYGYYFLNRHLLAEDAKYVDFTMLETKIGPYIVYVSGFCKLLGQRWIVKLLHVFLGWVAKKRNFVKLPVKMYIDHFYKKS